MNRYKVEYIEVRTDKSYREGYKLIDAETIRRVIDKADQLYFNNVRFGTGSRIIITCIRMLGDVNL